MNDQEAYAADRVGYLVRQAAQRMQPTAPAMAQGGGVHEPSTQEVEHALQELLTPGAPEQLAEGGAVELAGGGEVGIAERLAQFVAKLGERLKPAASAAPAASAVGPLSNEEHLNLMRRFGGTPGAQNQLSLEEMNQLIGQLSRSPSEAQLLSPTSAPQFAGGGRVELIEKIGELLDHIASQRAAREADLAARVPDRPRLPLQQLPEDDRVTAGLTPPEDLAPVAAPQSPLQPGFLTRRQAMADGGPVDDTRSSIRRLADAARALNPRSGAEAGEDRARIATNLASLVYGLDAKGQPAFGGRAWTTSQGGTPAGILDALTAVPHNVVQLGALVDKYLPGKSNPQFWSSIDPQWSQQAAQRLSQLRQRLQQSAGVAPAKSFEEAGLDMITDPALIAPLGAGEIAAEGSALRRALILGEGGTEDSTLPAQGAGHALDK
jgi:hypothetical protein